MHSHSPWIRVLTFSFAALALSLSACSSSTTDGMTAADTGVDAGGFLKECTMLGMPGDCPPGENLTCRSYPNPPPGKDLCTRPCTPATVAVDCPPPSKGCGGMGLCAGP